MAVERKFVADGVRKVRVERHLTRELKRAGYGGMDLVRTPLGTQVTIFAEKPGIVIGKGGKVVRGLTQDLATTFGVESPQIEVQQVENPNLNAQIMAERLASALERGWYFRKAGSSTIRRIMESGALGCEVVLSGKLTGARGRVQKFVEGYIKHSGDPVNTIVDKGYAIAIKKLGIIGIQVRIIPPDAKLPDHFEVTAVIEKKARVQDHIQKISDDEEGEDLDLDAIIEEERGDEFIEEDQ